MPDVSNIVAILDRQPVDPERVRVTADVIVPNLGAQASLKKAKPQGINPDILLLHVEVHDSGGVSGQALTTRSVRYDESPAERSYVAVTIVHGPDSFSQDFQIVQ